MNVAVAVAAASVPQWHRAAIDALRALDGVTVTVVDVPPRTRRALRSIESRWAGQAMANAPVAADCGALTGYDVVLNLAAPDLEAGARHGVWSFRLGAGDEALPFATEVASSAHTADVALISRCDGREAVLRRGTFPIPLWYPTLLRLTLNEAARWPATFVAALRDGVVPPRTDIAASLPRTARAPSRARFAAALAHRFVTGMRDAFLVVDQWNVGFAPGGPRALVDGARLDVTWLATPAARSFVADPFVVVRDGMRVLFLEEFNYARNRGVIDALVLDERNAVVRRMRALQIATHLSYPFPLEIGGELYLVPESSAENEVALYRCVEFPDRWERTSVLFPFAGIDTTVFAHDGRWWAFCTRRETGPGVALHAYHAASPRGPWTPHALNPIVVDVSCARPAGPPFVVDGVLYRTGQDCSRTYGGAVVLARVDELSPTAYAERAVRRIEAPPGPFPDGLHTLSFCGDTIVLDGKRTYYDVRNVMRGALAVRDRLGALLSGSRSQRAAAASAIPAVRR